MEKYNIVPYRIGYDRYSAAPLVQDLTATFGAPVMIPVAQGAKTLSIPLQSMKTELQNKNINFNNNQLLRWCLSNLMVIQDSNGNLNTVKNRNSSIRDDAAMALLDALTVYYDTMGEYDNLISY